jgi:hypothetical protein
MAESFGRCRLRRNPTSKETMSRGTNIVTGLAGIPANAYAIPATPSQAVEIRGERAREAHVETPAPMSTKHVGAYSMRSMTRIATSTKVQSHSAVT